MTLCFALESLKETWFKEGALSNFGEGVVGDTLVKINGFWGQGGRGGRIEFTAENSFRCWRGRLDFFSKHLLANQYKTSGILRVHAC